MATTSFNFATLAPAITVVGYTETTNGYGGAIKGNSRLMLRVTNGRAVRLAMKSAGQVATVMVSINGAEEVTAGSTTTGFARELITLDAATELGNRDYNIGFSQGTNGYIDLTATIEVDTEIGDAAPTVGLISGLVPAIDLRVPPSHVQILGRFASYGGWSNCFTNEEGSLRVVGKFSKFSIWIDNGLENSIELYEGAPGAKLTQTNRVVDAGTGEGSGNTRGKLVSIETSGLPAEDKVYHLILPSVVGSVLVYGTLATAPLSVPPTWIFAVDSITLAASVIDDTLGDSRPLSGHGHARRLCAIYDRNYYGDGVPFRKVVECSGDAYTSIPDVEAIFYLGGTNDNGSGVPANTFEAAATDILEAFVADKPDAHVFVMGAPDSGDAPLSTYDTAWRNAIASVANLKIHDASVEGAFTPYGAGNPNFRSDEHTHPIRFGYSSMMSLVEPTLDEVFFPPASGNAGRRCGMLL